MSIRQAGPDHGGRKGLSGRLPAALGQGQQMPRQIAAIHGREIAGLQRMQVAGIIPVEEMPMQPWQLGQGAQGRLQARDGIVETEPAEIASGQHGQQIKTEVGG